MFLASALGSVILLALLGLAALGTTRVIRGGLPTCHGRANAATVAQILVIVILNFLVMSQPVDAVQSRHCAPAEFAIVLLAFAGVMVLRTRWGPGNLRFN